MTSPEKKSDAPSSSPDPSTPKPFGGEEEYKAEVATRLKEGIESLLRKDLPRKGDIYKYEFTQDLWDNGMCYRVRCNLGLRITR